MQFNYFSDPLPPFPQLCHFQSFCSFHFLKDSLIGIPPILITHLHISKSRNQRTVTLNPKIKIDIAKVPQSPPITNRVIREVLNKKKGKGVKFHNWDFLYFVQIICKENYIMWGEGLPPLLKVEKHWYFSFTLV